MYATVKQRPSGPAKFAGVAMAVLVTAVVGYALTTGLAQDIVKTITSKTELAILQAPPKPEPPKPKEKPKVEKPPTQIEPPPLIVAPPEITPVETPQILAVAEPAPVVDPGPPTPPAPSTGSNETPPKLKSADKPPYPVQSVRAQEQGTTGLQVCVDTGGHVTQASVADSSGHPRLDEAALTWIKRARFAPGSVGGVPQNMCGHEVFYQWNLEQAGRS